MRSSISSRMPDQTLIRPKPPIAKRRSVWPFILFGHIEQHVDFFGSAIAAHQNVHTRIHPRAFAHAYTGRRFVLVNCSPDARSGLDHIGELLTNTPPYQGPSDCFAADSQKIHDRVRASAHRIIGTDDHRGSQPLSCHPPGTPQCFRSISFERDLIASSTTQGLFTGLNLRTALVPRVVERPTLENPFRTATRSLHHSNGFHVFTGVVGNRTDRPAGNGAHPTSLLPLAFDIAVSFAAIYHRTV